MDSLISCAVTSALSRAIPSSTATGELLIKLSGKESNRDGIGARVTLVAGRLRQMDEVRSGGSFISHNDLRLHFGIGDAARVDRAEVLWPSGRFEAFEDLKANQVVVLQEGRGKPLAQKPRQVKH